MTWHWSYFLLSVREKPQSHFKSLTGWGKVVGGWGWGGGVGWREVYKVRRDCRDYHCMIKIMARLHVIKEMHSRLDKKKEKENGKPVTALFTHRNFMQTCFNLCVCVCVCVLLLLLFFGGGVLLQLIHTAEIHSTNITRSQELLWLLWNQPLTTGTNILVAKSSVVPQWPLQLRDWWWWWWWHCYR